MFSTLSYILRHPLNEGRKLSALGRYFRWQLGSSLLPSLIAVPFVDNTSLFIRKGMTGATGNWYCGLHEYREMAFVLHLLRPYDLFVDIGANIGSYTVLAAGVVGARVVSVEPVPITCASLRTNVPLNGVGDLVNVMQVGLADRCGTLRFTSNKDTQNHVVLDSDEIHSVELPVMTLDEVCKGEGPLAIKIDAEGFEGFILDGALRTLAKDSLLAVVMETNEAGVRYGNSTKKLLARMEEYGFVPCSYDPFGREIVPMTGDSGNTIFVRNLEEIHARVRTAPRYRLVNGEI